MSNRRRPTNPVAASGPMGLGVRLSEQPAATYRREVAADILTVDVHPGVTPMLVSHQAYIIYATREWYRPSGLELVALNDAEREHVTRGGLLLRERTRT